MLKCGLEFFFVFFFFSLRSPYISFCAHIMNLMKCYRFLNKVFFLFSSAHIFSLFCVMHAMQSNVQCIAWEAGRQTYTQEKSKREVSERFIHIEREQVTFVFRINIQTTWKLTLTTCFFHLFLSFFVQNISIFISTLF